MIIAVILTKINQPLWDKIAITRNGMIEKIITYFFMPVPKDQSNKVIKNINPITKPSKYSVLPIPSIVDPTGRPIINSYNDPNQGLKITAKTILAINNKKFFINLSG